MFRPFLRLAFRRPRLWPALAASAWAFRRRDWLKRPPFLPLPSRAYMRWRMETAYGHPGHVPTDREIADFVVWSVRMRRWMRPGGGSAGARAVAIAVVAVAVVWVNVSAVESEAARAFAAAAGYPGLLAVSVASGFNLVAPVPVAFLYPFLIESGFEPLPTLAVISVGMTGGDFLGYLVGRAGRNLGWPRLARLQRGAEDVLAAVRKRHRLLPYAILFLYAAFAPIPNELVVIPLAFGGYPLAGVVAAVLAGNAIFNTLAAFGVAWLFA